MAIPVAVMCRVAVTIMQVVHVVAMGNSDVPAALAVLVFVGLVNGVLGCFALVPVAFMLAMNVAVVYVVGVIAVREGDVAAAFAVDVGVLVVDGVGHGSSWRSGIFTTFSVAINVSKACFQSTFNSGGGWGYRRS